MATMPEANQAELRIRSDGNVAQTLLRLNGPGGRALELLGEDELPTRV